MLHQILRTLSLPRRLILGLVLTFALTLNLAIAEPKLLRFFDERQIVRFSANVESAVNLTITAENISSVFSCKTLDGGQEVPAEVVGGALICRNLSAGDWQLVGPVANKINRVTRY